MQNFVRPPRVLRPCSTISARRFVAPITLVGLTALSVEMRTNVSTLQANAASAACQVLRTLL